jgi:glycosyltransferase involved in cell wall biosynthesis
MDARGYDDDLRVGMGTERTSDSTPRRRPRVLFVGSSDLDLPLPPALAKKWDALSRELDVRVIGRARSIRSSDPRFRRVPRFPWPLRSLGYWASLPAIVADELRRFRPEVIITKSPYEAFVVLPVQGIARRRAKLLVDLHGDWRTAPRLYGSPMRRLVAGLTDRAAVYSLRRADGIRAISAYTAGLAGQATGREPLSVFPAYFDLETFTAEAVHPLPDPPAIAWVGVLQRYKNPRMLADAWRVVASRSAEARLAVVGNGPLWSIVDQLAREFPTRVRAIARLTPAEVATLLDESTALAMSSESEGLPRVIMEAFARGRPVVSTAVGGVPDLVASGRNGLLVAPGDTQALAGALLRVVEDRDLATRLSRGALQTGEDLGWTPDRYAQAVGGIVESALNASAIRR